MLLHSERNNVVLLKKRQLSLKGEFCLRCAGEGRVSGLSTPELVGETSPVLLSIYLGRDKWKGASQQDQVHAFKTMAHWLDP